VESKVKSLDRVRHHAAIELPKGIQISLSQHRCTRHLPFLSVFNFSSKQDLARYCAAMQ
jgi:hypothetical protein